MRAVFGLVAIVVVLFIAMNLSKKQLQQAQPLPGSTAASAAPAAQAVQQQVQGALETAAQRASEAQP